MRELFETVERWHRDGHQLALATVVNSWKSSPRPIGSVMLVSANAQVWGSVSGGCVESAVIEAALDVMRNGIPVSLEFGGLEPEQIWDIGLSCGGRIKVFVEPCPALSSAELWQQARSLTQSGKGYVWAVSQGGDHAVFPAAETRDHPWQERARLAYEDRHSQEVNIEGEWVFFDVRRPVDRLVIIGGVHIAVPLVKIAGECGFETIVIEPRSAFADASRFPIPPNRILADWPEPALATIGLNDDTYAVTLTHDPKIDDQALRVLLRSPVSYIGALGSRTTQEQRKSTLLAEGFTDEELAKIHGPVGLDIGALTPEEIALSIVAEIVKVKRGLTK